MNEGNESSFDHLQATLAAIREVALAAKVIAEEKTKRAQIRADLEVKLGQIKNSREIVTDYLERSFDERRQNFDGLFARLDTALSGEDIQAVAITLDSIVKLADASPFKALRDVAATREMLETEGTEWEF